MNISDCSVGLIVKSHGNEPTHYKILDINYSDNSVDIQVFGNKNSNNIYKKVRLGGLYVPDQLFTNEQFLI